MASWTTVAGLVAVAAITPGPNNLIVMRAAARPGVRGAAPAVAAVVLGSVALVVVVVLGGDAAFRAFPRARTAVTVAGCSHLAWTGGWLVATTFRRDARQPAPADPPLPERAAALFAFQFLNPKGWVMALTATSAVETSGAAATLGGLVPLFVAIPAVCLLAWSSLGSLLGGALRRPGARRWADRIMGTLLFASALLLLVEP